LLALAVIGSVYGLELMLPVNFFTYRAWEALCASRGVFEGPFYPGVHITMIEKGGDLSHHGPLAVQRKVEWKTDMYGQRTGVVGSGPHDIVIVGDSNVPGSGLTQDDILSAVLGRRLKLSVYPYYSQWFDGFFDEFLREPRFVQAPPAAVVMAVIERNIRHISPLSVGAKNEEWYQSAKRLWYAFFRAHPVLGIAINRIHKNTMCMHAKATIDRFRDRMVRAVTARLARGPEQASAVSASRMLFLEGASANGAVSSDEIERIARIIKTYDTAARARGIRFILLPIPNKENIYHAMIPGSEKPRFLDLLIRRLRRDAIEVVDTQTAFDDVHRSGRRVLFQPDDSHWSADGVETAVVALEPFFRKR